MQKTADVLLFLEDIDGPDANVARLSFSTKTTDYLSSGRCIFAIGNKNDSALVAGSENEISDILNSVSESPKLLLKYAQKAADVGIKNHSKENITAHV